MDELIWLHATIAAPQLCQTTMGSVLLPHKEYIMENVAVYAGTFDPITNGHVDIAQRAAKLYDKLIVAVAVDNYKNNLFTTEERCALAAQSLADQKNVVVMPFSGLLVDFCQQQRATSIIRGLRAVSDFDHELQMALLNRNMNNHIDSVFLMSDVRYLYISSSLMRNISEAGGDISKFVPKCVCEAMKNKF